MYTQTHPVRDGGARAEGEALRHGGGKAAQQAAAAAACGVVRAETGSFRRVCGIGSRRPAHARLNRINRNTYWAGGARARSAGCGGARGPGPSARGRRARGGEGRGARARGGCGSCFVGGGLVGAEGLMSAAASAWAGWGSAGPCRCGPTTERHGVPAPSPIPRYAGAAGAGDGHGQGRGAGAGGLIEGWRPSLSCRCVLHARFLRMHATKREKKPTGP